MPYWDRIVQDVNSLALRHGVEAFDITRTYYLREISNYTKRDTLLYAMNENASGRPDEFSINFSDIHGMMSVMPGFKSKELDIILHSAGGSGEAAKAIIDYLRQKWDRIRIIVPMMSMSAGTMLACGADVLMLGKHSFLGPIDPQILILSHSGPRLAAAQNILNQFEMAKRDLAQGVSIEAWEGMLKGYGPDILALCESSKGLSRDIVRNFLESFMFKDDENKESRARNVADWLSNHTNFLSHGRFISRPELVAKGLKIEFLEEDEVLQDYVCSAFHVTMMCFRILGIKKIIQNQEGDAYITTDLPIALPRIPEYGNGEEQKVLNTSDEQDDQQPSTADDISNGTDP